MTFYAGLMSGTSLDGMDGILIDFAAAASPVVRAFEHRPFPTALRDELLALNSPGSDELHRAALAANAHVDVAVSVVQALLTQAGLTAQHVRAIGSHGQTVRHRPRQFDGTGYTLQLNNGALLAERAGIDVVCDFRSRDVAAGGQGAPLVPAFHAEAFGRAGEARAVLNLGGIANLTLLDDGRVRGFDTGPANVLLDAWAARHLGRAFDNDGAWGAGGRVAVALLDAMRADPYFAATPPKSTGRDHFNPDWLAGHLSHHAALAPEDVQATLCELTARTVADALLQHAAATKRVIVCGGGAYNADLLHRLRKALPAVVVETSDVYGLAPNRVEAAAFAWLAKAFVERRAGNRAEVTGACGPRLLGALYPA